MYRTSVSSSNLVSVGYENGILEIEFHDGSIYQYHNIPDHIYRGLMSASSKGTYLDQYVKKAGYSYTKIR